jgi:AraC-like DNA-binding protein
MRFQPRAFAFEARFDVRTAFCDWMRALDISFQLNHAPRLGTQVAALIRAEPAKSRTAEPLAARPNTSERRLRREFRHVYSVAVADYVHLVRLNRAVRDISEHRIQIEAIALQVGYRSKKDLYRACSKLLDTTPAALRRLSTPERQGVYDAIQARLSPRRRAIVPPPRHISPARHSAQGVFEEHIARVVSVL